MVLYVFYCVLFSNLCFSLYTVRLHIYIIIIINSHLFSKLKIKHLPLPLTGRRRQPDTGNEDELDYIVKAATDGRAGTVC